MMKYIKSLVNSNSADSSKSFSLIMSVLIGGIIGLSVCFVIIYDVISNGYIKTNLNDLGILMLCVGGYIAGGGVNKAVAESTKNKSEKNNKTPENKSAE